jgi:hypothetical protein
MYRIADTLILYLHTLLILYLMGNDTSQAFPSAVSLSDENASTRSLDPRIDLIFCASMRQRDHHRY